jgi:anti-anti-sigma factor
MDVRSICTLKQVRSSVVYDFIFGHYNVRWNSEFDCEFRLHVDSVGVLRIVAIKRFDVSLVDGVTIVHLLDEDLLEELTVQSLGADLLDLVDDGVKILINFAAVRNLSSMVLGRLIAIHKRLQAVSGQMKLCNLADNLAEVFEITKINQIIEIHHDEAAALAAF